MQDEVFQLIDRLVREDRTIDPNTLEWQIHEYLTALRVNRKPSTVDHARRYLNRFAQWCRSQGISSVTQIRANHIRQWQLQLLEQYQNRDTVWSISCDVRAFLNWCVREGVIKEPPFRPGDFVTKPRPRPKPMSLDEVKRLLETAGGRGWIAMRNRALIATLLYTGVRRGELLQMRIADLQQGRFVVNQKGDRTHVVYLDDEVIVEIHRYLRAYVRETGHKLRESDLLWRSTAGRALSPNGLRLTMERISKRSGIDVWCHRLRATSATIRLALGAPTEAVRAQLGHASLRSIEHYVKLAEQDLQRILEETSPLRAARRDQPGR